MRASATGNIGPVAALQYALWIYVAGVVWGLLMTDARPVTRAAVALLWPLDPNCADAAIDAAVQKANAGLPDYARIGRWVRLDTPFSPANGLLTANGRPKRDAILARYREHFSEPVNA